jgi:UDP-arabinose 4-epimerase
MSEKIIVTGGAGYIGSHVCLALAEAGLVPVTIDTLERGHREAVQWGPLEVVDVLDRPAVRRVLAHHKPVAAVHCAAYTLVGESSDQPQRYLHNNVEGTRGLIEVMLEAGVNHLVFSSTSAVYGDPHSEAVNESHPLDPQSPYGASKVAAERIIREASGLSSAILRYFNAAGADTRSRIGEAHEPETHLLPVVLDVAAGKRSVLTVYGTDYPTPDGTCIRDYVHVSDVAEAHVTALRKLLSGAPSLLCNLGNGAGFSVRQVIEAAQKITGREIPQTLGARRPGDTAKVIADCTLARRELAWDPQRSTLDTIIADAWNWHRRMLGI